MNAFENRVAIVTYTDAGYKPRALRTIQDIREQGKFTGAIVVMTDDSSIFSDEMIQRWNLQIRQFPSIDVTFLLEAIRAHPFRNWDGREYTKTQQWNKFHVFDLFFRQWEYIMFVDAGLRIFDSVALFWPQFRVDSIVAPDDAYPEMTKRFHCQIELSNIPVVQKLNQIYDLNSSYFLNCIFLFHTTLIEADTVDRLVEMMNTYPICKTNEMAIMNIAFHRNWIPMQIHLPDGRHLFDWSERNGNHYSSYVSLKYPQTINLETPLVPEYLDSILFGSITDDREEVGDVEPVEDSNWIGFIHSYTSPTNGTRILKYLLRAIIRSRLLFKLRYLIINNVGIDIELEDILTSSPKNIILMNSSDSSAVSTLQKMHFLAQLHPDCKILYLHTKGATYPPSHPFYKNIRHWSNFMLYSTVFQHEICCKILDRVDVAGCNYRPRINDQTLTHFSGNFWWARGSYIRQLSVQDLKTKEDAKWWLFRGNPTFVHLAKSRTPERHYEMPFPAEQYIGMVNTRLQSWNRLLTSTSIAVFYGAGDIWIDITLICRDRLWTSGILNIPAGDMERNAIFGDPLVGTTKAIRIHDLLFPYTEAISIPVPW